MAILKILRRFVYIITTYRCIIISLSHHSFSQTEQNTQPRKRGTPEARGCTEHGCLQREHFHGGARTQDKVESQPLCLEISKGSLE